MRKNIDHILYKNLLISNLTLQEQEDFIRIVQPIIYHEKFKERCTEDFPHHSNISLGEHIIKDALVTYKLVINYNKTHIKKANLEIAVTIALFHDLYTKPWQNAENRKSIFNSNTFGMVHPIEAVLNSSKWFPEYFKEEETSKIIIDGILHHMFPFPVSKVAKEDLDITNKNLLKNFKYYDTMIESTNNCTNFKIDIKRSKSIEGRLMSKADKIVAVKEIKNISSLLALLTAKNKSLTK